MNIKNPQLLKKLKSKASQSISKFSISAFGFNSKNELVGRSTNKPFLDKYGGGIHAESNLFKVAAKKNIKTIIICRIGKQGNLLHIHPCSSCQKIANKLGIKIISIY